MVRTKCDYFLLRDPVYFPILGVPIYGGSRRGKNKIRNKRKRRWTILKSRRANTTSEVYRVGLKQLKIVIKKKKPQSRISLILVIKDVT